MISLNVWSENVYRSEHFVGFPNPELSERSHNLTVPHEGFTQINEHFGASGVTNLSFVCIQAEWENQNKQKSVVHLDSYPPPLLYTEYWASSTVSLNSREILGQDGYRNARWVPAHLGTTLTNEKPNAPYLVGTSEAKDQCKRLNRWVGSWVREYI